MNLPDLPTNSTVPEVADLLRCSQEEVRRRARSGEIPGAVRDGHPKNGRLLFPRADLQAYLLSLPSAAR